MSTIFISYRRSDSATASGRIYDRLVQRFGKKNVFKDVDDIPPGVNFPDYIQETLRHCMVVLVVIGRSWLESRDEHGQRRLDAPGDPVRLEIETAQRLGLPILPLLVEGATMPAATQLPTTLQPLVLINAVQVRDDPDFTRDMERLIGSVERILASQRTGWFGRRRPTITPTDTPMTRAGTAASMPTNTPPPTPSPSIAPEQDVAPPRPGQPNAFNIQPQESLPDNSSIPPKASTLPAVELAGKPANTPALAIDHTAAHRGKGRRSKKGVVLALFAVLVAAVSSAALLTQSSGLFGIGARPTSTVSLSADDRTATVFTGTSTAYERTIQASETAFVKSLFPYFAAAPGANCDKGNARWGHEGNLLASQDTICHTTYTELVSTHQNVCSSCSASTAIVWDPTRQNVPLPSQYSVSVTVANLSPCADAVVSAKTTNALYAITFQAPGAGCGGGGYEYFYCPDGVTNCGLPAMRPYTVQGSQTVAIGFVGNTISLSIGSMKVDSRTESSQLALDAVSLGVDCGRSAQSTADFSNFSVRP